MILNKAFKNSAVEKNMTLTDPSNWPAGWRRGDNIFASGSQSAAMKISAVNNCVEVLSNSIAKLPMFVINSKTKEHIDHDILRLLTVRPNEMMTPFVFKKYMECQRLLTGNAYAFIHRDRFGRPALFLPLPSDSVAISVGNNKVTYKYTNPKTRQEIFISNEDMIHLKAYSEDGINGISVLERARMTIDTAGKQQTYENTFYSNNARPSGIMTIPTKINKDAKDKMRDEWDSIYNGVEGMHKVAILDGGIDYKPLGINQSDSQFIESKGVSVEDICRFFGVPLYKVQAGKQSYASNEQNAIEFVVGTLHPVVTQWEEEFTYKGFTDSEIDRDYLRVKVNMNAEMRGSIAARAQYYKAMREIGEKSVNELRALEDEPAVPGGDVHYASLNYVPLEFFEELSKKRNGRGE